MITSDQGPQFPSNLWSALLNISHRQTSADHPEENGTAKRLYCLLKDALPAHAAATTWPEEIPWVLLGLHSQLREDTGLSPAEAVFGTTLVPPKEFLKAEEFSIDQISKFFPKI
jgi:hypothetical protein